MGEHNFLILAFLALVLSASYSYLQAIGGRSQDQIPYPLNKIGNRIWSRWIAPIYFSSCVCLIAFFLGNFNWWFLLSIPLYKISTSFGPGADTLVGKIYKRTLNSIMRVVAALPIVILTGYWDIYISQVIVGLTISNIWGISNPKIAPLEESVINFSNVFLVTFMVM